MKIKCFILLFPIYIRLFCPGSILWADEREEEKTQPKACVFQNVDLSSSEVNAKYQGIITDLLKVELKSAGFIIIPQESLEDVKNKRGFSNRDLILGANAISLAAELKADLAVTGFYRVEDRRITLDIKCYDVAQKTLMTGILKTGRLDLSVYNLIDTAFARMLPEIRFIREGPGLEEPVELPVQEITLLSPDEDMAVYLGGERFVGRISQGILTFPAIPFKIGTEVTIEKRKVGFHTAREVIRLNKEKQKINLKALKKKTRHATEMCWTSGQFMGFGIGQRYYLNPDYFFISGEHYFFIQHNFKDSRPVFHNDLKFLLGCYLFLGPNSSFRLGLSTGPGVVLTYFSIPGQPLFTDFYLNLVNFWLECNLKDWTIFIRLEGKYGLGLGKNLLGSGWWMVGGYSPPITIGLIRKW